MVEERFSTGVKELDDLLGGGVQKGVNILVRGGTGTGKTTFSLQYLVEGARLGERGMYLTFEESAGQIVKYGSRFFPDLKSHIETGTLQILDFSPLTMSAGKTRMVEGERVSIPEKEFVDSTTYIDDKIKDIRGQTIRRVVIDGLQTFATTFYDLSGKRDSDELRRTLSRILVMLKKEDITTYILSEEVDEQTDRYEFANFSVDGVFVMKVNEALDMRMMRILKMRGISHTLKPLAIQLIDGKGVVIVDHQKGRI